MEPTGWIKLWRKTRYDAKVRALGDSEFRLWVNLLMIASHEKKTVGQIVNEADGRALSVRQIATESGMAQTVTYRGLVRLCELGLCQRQPLPFGRQGHLYRIPKFGRYQQVDDRSATGTPVPPEERLDGATVPQSVPESVPQLGNALRNGAHKPPPESTVPPEEHLEPEMVELQDVDSEDDRSATGTDRSATGTVRLEKERSKEGTSKDPAPSAIAEDAGRRRRAFDEDELLIEEAYFAYCQQALPKGRLKEWSGLREVIARRGFPLVRELIAAWEVDETDHVPEGGKAWPNFCTAFRGGLNRPWEWRKQSGGNGPDTPRQSWRGWPTRFEVQLLTGTFTDEEVSEVARSPDWFEFPWSHVNGSEQQRAEKAHRAFLREQASDDQDAR